MGFRQERKNTGVRRYWPVIGFVMVVVLGTIAFIAAPAVYEATKDLFPAFSTRGVNRDLVRIGYTVVIFLVLAMISGTLLALASPKTKMQIKDKDLQKMREDLLKQKEAEKQRMRKLNRDMRNR